MHAIANRGVWTHVRVCAERRLREKNPLMHQGPWASLSSVPVRHVTHWATSPPFIMCPVTNTAVHAQSFHTVVKSLISTGPAVHRMADPRTACNGLKSSFQSWHANRLKTSPASYKTSLSDNFMPMFKFWLRKVQQFKGHKMQKESMVKVWYTHIHCTYMSQEWQVTAVSISVQQAVFCLVQISDVSFHRDRSFGCCNGS